MHDYHDKTPNFCTNPEPGRAQAFDNWAPIWRMKVTATNVGGNPHLLTCVNCNYNGTVVGTIGFSVVQVRSHTVGDLIFAFRPGGGTGETKSSRDIWWMETIIYFDVRYNTSVTPPRFEKTFTPNPTDSDWIDITDGTPCGG